MKRTFIAAAALMLLAVSASAQDAVKIAWVPKVGSTMKYALKSNATGIQTPTGTGDLVFSTTLTHKVLEIKPDGKILVEEKQSDFSGKMGDMDITNFLPKLVTETYTYAPTGEILQHSSDAPQSNPRLENINAFVFPSQALKVGDTWKRTTKADSAKGVYSTDTTYTYQGIETVGTWTCYKIGVDFKETDAPTNMSALGTVWLNKDDGELVKADFKAKAVEFQPGMPPIDTTIVITRTE